MALRVSNDVASTGSVDRETPNRKSRYALHRVAAPVVVVRLDMPPEPVMAALIEARQAVRIGNLVPHPDLDPSALNRLDALVVNHHEAAEILNTTAGPYGAAFSHVDRSATVRAAKVRTVDTTGAGDAFIGRLALDLSTGLSLPDAVARAVRVGTGAVQHEGAQLPAQGH